MSFRFLLSFLLFIAWTVKAEENIKKLSEVIKSLSTPEVQIIYSNDLIDADQSYIDIKIESIAELTSYLLGKNLVLEEVLDGVFIIKPLKDNGQIKRSKTMFVGRILDGKTSLPIRNSEVFGLSNGLSYKKIGQLGYAIQGYPGEQISIEVVADGYATQSDVITMTNDTVTIKEYSLVEIPQALENLYVTTSLFDFAQFNHSNQSILSRDELITTPHAGNDAVRAVNKLPGITSNGISARIHVRGGKQDESQVILNGLSLNNPFHFKDFFGIFSAINLSYVDELSLYAGVFPARFGSYISSIMDIRSTEPKDVFFMDLSLGVLNSHVTFGDTVNNNFQYLLSYRSGGDLFRAGLLDVETGDPSYDDLFTHLKHQFNNGASISANVLQTKDSIDLNLIDEDEQAQAKYLDNNYWFTFEKPIGGSGYLSTVVSYQSFHTNRNGALFDDDIQGNLSEKRNTKHYGFSAEIHQNLSERMNASVGVSLQRQKTHIEFETQLSGTDFISEILNPDQLNRSRSHRFNNEGNKAALFFNIRSQFNAKLYGDFGLRLEHQDWIAKTQVSPRLNMSYFFDDSTTFRFGLGRHFQNQNIDGVLLEDSHLVYFKTESANIAIFEIQREFDPRHYLRAEFYYKDYNNVQPYYENMFVDLHINPELFSDRIRIDPDTAFSKGVDITFAGLYDHFNWSASYSFSEVKDVINNQETLRDWDQQNAVKLNLGWSWNDWQFNSLLQYHTGWPRTQLEQIDDSIIIGNRNSKRYQDYLSANLRLSYLQNFKKSKVKYWLQINNAFNRNNPCCSDYDFDQIDDGSFELVLDQKDWMPLIPSIGIDISF